MKCENCGKDVAIDGSFCPFCGHKLARTCTHCGRELGPEINFCPNCGTQSTAGGGPSAPPQGTAQPLSPFMSDPNAGGAAQTGSPGAPYGTPGYGSPDQGYGSPPGSPLSGYGPDPAQGMVEIQMGETLLNGRFEIKSLLGKGGFGSVYLVRDREMNENLALKVVFPEMGQAQMAVDQLKHEYRLRDRIDRMKHILKGHLLFTDTYKGLDLILLPMAYAEGGSLRDWMRKNPLEVGDGEAIEKRLKQALDYFRQACLGVQAIHEAGLVHLDLKPENLLLQNNRVKVTDFGLSRGTAHLSVASPELLKDGVGTPVYMSPEQVFTARRKDLKDPSDIYALGVILYELLDGDPPFDGMPEEVKRKHREVMVPKLGTEVPGWLAEVAYQCLEKDPSGRYETVKHLLGALEGKDWKKEADGVLALIHSGKLTEARKELARLVKEGLPKGFRDQAKGVLQAEETEQKRKAAETERKRKEEEARKRAEEERKRREEEDRKRREQERRGIITDSRTGLEWYEGPDEDTDWDEAKRWVENLTVDGGGWRMPSRSELKGLYKEGVGNRNKDSAFKTTGWNVWSGETKGSSSACYFYFLYGEESSYSRDTSGRLRAFAVRSRR